MLLNLYFKTTCNIRLHFHGPIGGLTIEGPLYYLEPAVVWCKYLPDEPELLLLQSVFSDTASHHRSEKDQQDKYRRMHNTAEPAGN